MLGDRSLQSRHARAQALELSVELLRAQVDGIHRTTSPAGVCGTWGRRPGRSGATSCDESRSAAACAKKLGAKRAFLTTAETARDLDDLRAALELKKITPLGVSYGTKVAGEYARATRG